MRSCSLRHFSTTQSAPPSGSKVFTLGLGAVIGSLFTAGLYFAYDQKKNLDADSERISNYLKMIKQYPTILGPTGDASEGAIEIVTDPEIIKKIEDSKKQKTGVLAETAFQLYVCDPVKFPDGSYGTYTRTLWKQTLKGGPSGAAVLPILPDGKILLLCIYRHPLRKWALEIPRGNAEGAEQIKAIAKRELKEETGAEVSKQVVLGKFNADSGLTSGGISLVKATVSKFGNSNRDSAENSITLQPFTKDELEEAIRRGYAIVKINGKEEQVEIADSFTLGALYLSQLKGS